MQKKLYKYFYCLLSRYLNVWVSAADKTILCLHPSSMRLAGFFPKAEKWTGEIPDENPGAELIVVDGRVHYERDIQNFLVRIRSNCREGTRLVITFYSVLWRPLLRLATFLGWRNRTPEENWLAPSDMENLLRLADFEMITLDSRVICPLYIPWLSDFLNSFIAPLPFFRRLAMVNILLARPCCHSSHTGGKRPSVSIVVPARNEAGNIEDAVLRLPPMGPDDELIFVEGGSSDDTWTKIQEVSEKYRGRRNIVIARQDGHGKGDAVHKGFALASREILMILDADLTVPPEDLPKFYETLVAGKGEFINGSRLVYPMEGQAMRFFNMLGNKFFALAFTFVLGQSLKDTLCGTKVLTRDHYRKLASQRRYFGEFDPFGDFDLLFGAARLGLKIVEVPIVYRDRVYGATNISRWKHGSILLRMLIFGAGRLRFI